VLWKKKGLSNLVLITFVTFTAISSGFGTDFFVVFFEGSKILTSFGEFTFFHTFTDVPVDESTLGVHKVELVVEAREDFSDGSGVGDHADGALHFGKVTTRDNGWRLVVDTALETGRAPVNELDSALGLDGGNSGVDILRDNVTSVHEAASHVFTVARIALGHHGSRLESRVGDLGHRELLVVCLLSRDDRGIRGKHEVDTRVRDQVSLELSDIDVQSTVEAKRSSQRRDDLGDQSVQVGVGRAFNVQRAAADVVDGLVIKHNGDISVLKKRVGGQDGVVRLNNGSGHLRGRVHSETQFGFFTVVDGKALQKKRTQTGTCTTTDGVEDEETLKTSAVVSQLSDAVKGKVNNFFTNGVVTTGVVVGGIFLTGDQLLRVEQLTVGTSANLVNDGRLKVQEDGTRDVFAGTSFGEKGVEGVVTTTDGLVRRHLTIRLDTVLEAVKFPACITDLDTGLAKVD